MRHLVYVAESVMQYPAIHKMNYEDIRDILQEHFMAERERVKARIPQYGPLLGHEVKTYKHGQSMAADAL